MVGWYQNLRLREICLTIGLHTTGLKLATLFVRVLFFYMQFSSLQIYMMWGFLIFDEGFNYTKDSVLVVSEEEYKKCKATKPQLYSNNEDTVFKLDRPGLFYFISGISGHCEKGQKMIIKVMETESSPDSPPPSSPSSSSSSSPSLPASTHKKSSALKTAVQFSSSVFVVFAVLVVSVFGLA